MISGVWGRVTNKRFRRFSGYGKSAKMSLLYKKALLANLATYICKEFNCAFNIFIVRSPFCNTAD